MECDRIASEAQSTVTDILKNGKDTLKNNLGQKTHTLLGVLYTQKL